MSGGVREIPLSKGKAALVDAADFEWLSQWKWSLNGRYAMRHHRKAEVRDGRPWVIMHREIVRPEPALFVDHINGNGLDNRRANLRVCTSAQNTWNVGAFRPGKLKGAHRSANWWQAIIRCEGTRHYLGSFRTELEAALVYDAAALRLHGEFARLNFPEGTTAQAVSR